MLSIPADFSTSSEIKASCTTVTVIVIEFKESFTIGRSSMLALNCEN